MSDLAQLLEEIEEEFPRFRIVPKRGDRLSRLIDVLLKSVTLGGQSKYLTHYHTVIGDTLYLPNSWDSAHSSRRCGSSSTSRS